MENVTIPFILNSSVLFVIFTVCVYYFFINKNNDYMQYILHGLEMSTCSLQEWEREHPLCGLDAGAERNFNF